MQALKKKASQDFDAVTKRLKGMEGNGFYNANSQPQGIANELTFPVWRASVHHAVHNGRERNGPNNLIRIADYGASEGKNSIAVMKVALGEIYEEVRKEKIQVEITHLDLPTNDFNSLTQTCYKEETFPKHEKDVFVSCRGGSFYEQCFPNESVDLGYSAIATHWLSKLPSNCSFDKLYVHGLPQDHPAWKSWREQARQDWNQFVDNRYLELRPDGRFVQIGISRTSHGNGCEGFLHLVQEAVRAVFLPEDGEIMRKLKLPIYHRSLEEWVEPFHEAPDKWEIIKAYEVFNPDPAFAEYTKTGNFEKFADFFIGFIRAATLPGLLGFPQRLRSDAKKMDRFYEEVRKGLRANPELGRFEFALVVLCVQRH